MQNQSNNPPVILSSFLLIQPSALSEVSSPAPKRKNVSKTHVVMGHVNPLRPLTPGRLLTNKVLTCGLSTRTWLLALQKHDSEFKAK
ncbi:hypothetical protein PoB_000382400 [Plakobranchus ocellatus]|uniref:Uncharacterized protein n=1 Tax=Plakobranchus ocellatus TaxID=259542 RepID=A0AAV3Y5G2_9GAST|nr:hypothetical protein PoB_000382400 [Plakobranchus ocellatus]